jgi:RimJ/RimL family protein N-acetyltransferase
LNRHNAAVGIPEIRTDRLLLRGWHAADLAPFAALNADPVVMEHFPNLLDRASSDALVERITLGWRSLGFGIWAVERRDDSTFLGFAGLSRPAFDAPFMPAVEVGWRLARHAWGHGYATEAASAALQFGFDTVGLAEIVSFTVPANLRSRRVMDRIGMTNDPADDFDHPRLPEGHPLRRHVLYRVARAHVRRGRRSGDMASGQEIRADVRE